MDLFRETGAGYLREVFVGFVNISYSGELASAPAHFDYGIQGCKQYKRYVFGGGVRWPINNGVILYFVVEQENNSVACKAASP